MALEVVFGLYNTKYHEKQTFFESTLDITFNSEYYKGSQYVIIMLFQPLPPNYKCGVVETERINKFVDYVTTLYSN